MRIACPPLVYPCEYLNFTASKSEMELITRRVIADLEGDHNANLEAYCKTDSPEYKKMVEEIRRRLGLTSLRFSSLENIVNAIGLPKCKVCTHCFDGSSHC
jgi:amidophosphoribosyltransferase